MNTQNFQSRFVRWVFASGKCFLIIATFLSATAFAQTADLSTVITTIALPNQRTPNVQFVATVLVNGEENEARRASGAILRVMLPDGAVPEYFFLTDKGVPMTDGECNFAGNVVTCDLGELIGVNTLGQNKSLVLSVKPAVGARSFTVKAHVTANEFDPNIDNNSVTSTILLKTTRDKRTRVF